jgi:SAM-dependent methyltransferase
MLTNEEAKQRPSPSKNSIPPSVEDVKQNTVTLHLFRFKSWLKKPLRHKINSIIWLYYVSIFHIYKIRGYDFGGNISNKELVTEFENVLAHATAYQPSRIHDINDFLKEIRFTGLKFDTFLDVGCGKGLVCIHVAKKLNIQKIIGFDFSKPLIEVALKNLDKSQHKNISFIVDDATKYLINDENTLIFLFNPFDEMVLNEFIKNNIPHFLKNKSAIVYSNDMQRQVLIKHGFETIYRSQKSNTSIWKYQNIQHAPPPHG